jgi:hypothetical protein
VDVEDLPWMARFLAGLGVRVIVRHPAELRTVLREYALALLSDAERADTHPASLGPSPFGIGVAATTVG